MKAIGNRFRQFAVVSVVVLFLMPQAAFGARVETKAAACSKQKIDKWTGHQLSKQKNKKTLNDINAGKYRFAAQETVITPAQEIPVKHLGKLPSLSRWRGMSGGINYTRFNVIQIRENVFVIADDHKKCSTEGTQDFYLCRGDDYIRVLRLNHVSEKITTVKLDNMGAEFIKTEDNPCGTGWTGALYHLDKDDKLSAVLDLGGFRAGVYYVQLGVNETLTVVNAVSEYIKDPNLNKTIKKCRDFKEEYLTKPQLSHVTLFKWDGTVFKKYGEQYYHKPE